MAAALGGDLERIAERLRRRAAGLRRQELLSERRLGPQPLARLRPEGILAAQRLKEALLAEFRGARLEDLYPCAEVVTELGPALRLEHLVPQPLLPPERERSERALGSALRLLYGVGPATERRLRERGYRTLEDLASHPRFGPGACRVLAALRGGDLRWLKAEVERWFSPSHPLSLALLALAGEGLVLFDLESLGLFGRPLILLGLAWPQRDGLLVEQYLLRSMAEEPAALLAAARSLQEARALVTYNGRAFDLCYLEERLSYYGLRAQLDHPHFDLLHHARRRFAAELPDCRLETLERWVLGVERALDVPSALVPEFYLAYLRQRNVGPLVAIIEHNKQDLVSLALLLGRLCAEG